MGHEPGGTSTRTVWHYAQEINSGKFCKFDYNSMVQNWIHYRSFSPPEYDLKKVDVPVGLIWSDNDWLADPTVKYYPLKYNINTCKIYFFLFLAQYQIMKYHITNLGC